MKKQTTLTTIAEKIVIERIVMNQRFNHIKKLHKEPKQTTLQIQNNDAKIIQEKLWREKYQR